MSGPAEGSFRKTVVEGLVIIFSILAAFAIDAWWDNVQEQKRAQAEVASLRSEFDAANRELTRAAAELDAAYKATIALAQRAAPHAPVMTTDSFAKLVFPALTVNAVQLPTGALANVLASGDLQLLGDLELQTNLAAWPSIANLMSVKFGYLVAGRDESILPAVNRLTALSPLLTAWFPSWRDENRFDFDAAALLTNREFENLMVERSISIMIARGTVQDAKQLSDTIRARLAAWR